MMWALLHKWQFLPMNINIPELSLVLLVGASGSGKSTFAKKHFNEYEIVSSDICRGIVSNDVNSLDATTDAFDVLNYIVAKRLKNGLLTVVDATNVQKESRMKLIRLAKEYHALPVAIVLDLPLGICEQRNALRPDRNFGSRVIHNQKRQLKRSFKNIKREGFKRIFTFKSEEEVNQITAISREKLYNNKKELSGPFDIIGDIHGCYDETIELLKMLGYHISVADDKGYTYDIHVQHPENRQVIFLGDLVDRGPKSPEVLKLAMSMVKSGSALCVPGNHDIKLRKKLSGKDVQIKHGLAETLQQLAYESDTFLKEVEDFIYGLISHYVLDNGKLVVAHAGIKETMQGRGSGAVRSFCLYGETTGEIDEFGLPVRHNWALEYRGDAKVVYGHTAVPNAEWLNRTIDIDTGCVFGGKLTALRYPEEEIVSVKAKKVYCEPSKPLTSLVESPFNHQQEHDDVLNITDVTGKRIIQSRLRNNLTIKEEQSIAAIEVMSRFAVNPKWLIYLPPTMSPCETSDQQDYLEYPSQAFNYYRKKGVKSLICEEKHMGSRVVLILAKDEDAVLKHFGIQGEGIGICYTRSGRSFFNDKKLENAFIHRVHSGLTKAQFWENHHTDWVCLDAELMPWSAKAKELLIQQYASVGSAAKQSFNDAERLLKLTADRGIEDVQQTLDKYAIKHRSVSKFRDAYRNYCWDVKGIEDYKLAPFHILATEGNVHTDKSHDWHMENIATLCDADPKIFRKTKCKMVDLTDEVSIQEAIDWWKQLTSSGGEGMVVKPMDFICYGKDGLLQPAMKCRGKEYLRIIYGPEYDLPENLKRLKNRGLSRKRSLAIREFALGVESLERFVRKEPLRRVHESVFGVLALESDPVDPRL